MKYRITIEKLETVTRKYRDWKKLYDDEGFARVQEEDASAKQYGYVDYEGEEEIRTEIFKLEKDDINIKEAVDALNK